MRTQTDKMSVKFRL